MNEEVKKLIKTETHSDNTYTEYWHFISDEIIIGGEKRTFTENGKRIFLEQYGDADFATCYQIIQYGYEDENDSKTFFPTVYEPCETYHFNKEVLNSKDKCVLREIYTGECFDTLTAKTIIAYTEDGRHSEMCINYFALENEDYDIAVATKEFYDAEDRIIAMIQYSDIDCTQKRLYQTIEYSEDGVTETTKTIYYDSAVIEYQGIKSNLLIKNTVTGDSSETSYFDEEFKEIKSSFNIRTLSDGSTEITNFSDDGDDVYVSSRTINSADSSKVVTETFFDKEMTSLYSVEEVTRNPEIDNEIMTSKLTKTYSQDGKLISILKEEFDELYNTIKTEKEILGINIEDLCLEYEIKPLTEVSLDVEKLIPKDIAENYRTYIIEILNSYINYIKEEFKLYFVEQSILEQRQIYAQNFLIKYIVPLILHIVEADTPQLVITKILEPISYEISQLLLETFTKNIKTSELEAAAKNNIENKYKDIIVELLTNSRISIENFTKLLKK